MNKKVFTDKEREFIREYVLDYLDPQTKDLLEAGLISEEELIVRYGKAKEKQIKDLREMAETIERIISKIKYLEFKSKRSRRCDRIFTDKEREFVKKHILMDLDPNVKMLLEAGLITKEELMVRYEIGTEGKLTGDLKETIEVIEGIISKLKN